MKSIGVMALTGGQSKSVEDSTAGVDGKHKKKRAEAVNGVDFSFLMQSMLLPAQSNSQTPLNTKDNLSKVVHSDAQTTKVGQAADLAKFSVLSGQLGHSSLGAQTVGNDENHHVTETGIDHLFMHLPSEFAAKPKTASSEGSKVMVYDDTANPLVSMVGGAKKQTVPSASEQSLSKQMMHMDDPKLEKGAVQIRGVANEVSSTVNNVGMLSHLPQLVQTTAQPYATRADHTKVATSTIGHQLSTLPLAIQDDPGQTMGKEHVPILKEHPEAVVSRASSQKSNLSMQSEFAPVATTSPAVIFAGSQGHVEEPPTFNLHQTDASSQVAQIIAAQVSAGNNQIHVKVHPEGMGDLVISVSRLSTGIQVNVEANQMATMQWLGQQTQQLMNAMQQSGVNVTGIQLAFGQADLSNFKQGQSGKRDNDPVPAIRGIAKSKGLSESLDSSDSGAPELTNGTLNLKA